MKKTLCDVMTRVHHHALLSRIAELEQDRFSQIVTIALTYDTGAARWQAYERLKRLASSMVGFDATYDELATGEHYRLMLGLIDWLLPSESEDSHYDVSML